jgi:hypothetical protein
MLDPIPHSSSEPSTRLPGVAWLLILCALTMFGWFVADASARAVGDWNFASFLFAFPLPYVGAYLLLTLSGAVGAWPSAPVRVAITIGSLAVLVPLQALLVMAGFLVGIGVAPLGALPALVVSLLPLPFDRAMSLLGLLVACSTCAFIDGVLGAGLFELQRRLGLLEGDRARAWQVVHIGGGGLAGVLMLPAGSILESVLLPRSAGADGLLLRLVIAGGIIALIFIPHAAGSWWLLRRGRLQIRMPWAGAAAFALFLYLLPAFLAVDPAVRPDLAWPRTHLEARQTALEIAMERRARARAAQAERERMRPIPSGLRWNALTWQAPRGTRIEGDWSPLEGKYEALILIPAEAHPLKRMGVQAVRVREDASIPVKIVPASRLRQIGYYETCRPGALHDLTICWAVGNKHAREFSDRFGATPETDRVKVTRRLPYGDFLVAAEQPGFAASCILDDGLCEVGFAHGGRSVRAQVPLDRLESWQDVRREVSSLLREASGRPLDDRPGLVWLPPESES